MSCAAPCAAAVSAHFYTTSQTTAPPFEGASFLSGGDPVSCARAVLRTNDERRQVGEGARGKRVAEWPAEDAGARAPVRRRTGGGGSSSDDMIL